MFEACPECFTKKQWEVVCMYYRDGMTLAEIASCLGKATSTICGLLSRARESRKRYFKKLRREQLAQQKKA